MANLRAVEQIQRKAKRAFVNKHKGKKIRIWLIDNVQKEGGSWCYGEVKKHKGQYCFFEDGFDYSTGGCDVLPITDFFNDKIEIV